MAFNITKGQAIGTEWFLVVCSFTFLVGRVYVRGYLQRRFGASDGLAICAWLLFFTGASLDTHLMKLGFYNPKITYYGPEANIGKILPLDSIEQIFKILYAEVFIYYSSLWCVKLALLTLYSDMIPPLMHGVRRLLYFTGLVVAVGYVVLVLLFVFSCFPVQRNWNIYDPEAFCLSWNQVSVFLIVLSFHLITDIMLFTIPFILLRYLSLPRNKRLGVTAVFALGFLCISSTVTRTICVTKLDPPAVACIFSALEEGTAILVVCAPSLRVLVEKCYNKWIVLSTRRKRMVSGGTSSDGGSDRSIQRAGVFMMRDKGIGAVETIGTEAKGWRSRMGSGQVGIEGADIAGGRLLANMPAMPERSEQGILMTFEIDVEEAHLEYHAHRKQSCC